MTWEFDLNQAYDLSTLASTGCITLIVHRQTLSQRSKPHKPILHSGMAGDT